MKCIFCKTEEKQVRYMLTKDNISICDNCVLLLSKKLSEQIEIDNVKLLSNLNNNNKTNTNIIKSKKPTEKQLKCIDWIYNMCIPTLYGKKVEKKYVCQSFTLANKFIKENIEEAQNEMEKINENRSFKFTPLNNRNNQITKDDYESHINEYALLDSEDGEHGSSISARALNYGNHLSYEDYKNGKRIPDLK